MTTGSEWRRPGFGWVNDVTEVKLLGGKQPETMSPDQPFDLDAFIQTVFPDYSPSAVSMRELLFSGLEKALGATPELQQQLREFYSTGLSNSRPLHWTLMSIPPHKSFRLHAHPNIELIYVLCGTIHEYRWKEAPFEGKALMAGGSPVGPDLRQAGRENFAYRFICAAEQGDEGDREEEEEHMGREEAVLVNEVGSVHFSFTKEDGALLLVLWSGEHANVPSSHLPPDFDELLQQSSSK